MIEPISTSATVRLNCDSPQHNFTTDPAPEFFGSSVSDCARQARESGWKFSNKGGRCFCPTHQTKHKPLVSLFEQAMQVLEAVTNEADPDAIIRARNFIDQNAIHRKSAVEAGKNTSTSNADIQAGQGR